MKANRNLQSNSFSSSDRDVLLRIGSELLCVVDAEGFIQSLNDAWLEMFGYHSDELLYQEFMSFIHPEDVESAAALQDADTPATGVLRFRDRDGNSRILDATGLRTEGRLYIAARDVTERYVAELHIRQSEARFRSMAANIPGVLFRCRARPDWPMEFLSDKVVELTGYTALELVSQTDITYTRLIHMDDRRRVADTLSAAVTAGDSYSVAYRIIDAHGTERWVQETGSGIRSPDGGAMHIDGVVLDITARYRAEQQLNEYAARMEQQNRELDEAVEQARKAVRAKSEFLAGISHEIRTPLNAVIGFTDLLMRTSLGQSQLQYVSSAHTAAAALLEIINDILDYSKMEAGKLSLDPIETSVFEVASQSMELVQFAAADSGLELLLYIPDELPPYAVLDPVRVKQILVNLLSNAIKFTPEGEVELRVGYRPVGEYRGVLEFTVRDTGIGISAEQQDRLFQAFSQADTSTTRKFGGTGLGLVISSQLADRMGGHIDLNSRENAGSEFTLSLEVESGTGGHNDTEPDAVASYCHSALIVDDNWRSGEILQDCLQRWGIKSEVCRSGAEALQHLQGMKSGYDVLLIDQHMPEMGGLETVQRIRYELGLNAARQNIVLLTSAADGSSVYRKSTRLGVQGVLTKPVKPLELSRQLQQLYLDKMEVPALIGDSHERSPADRYRPGCDEADGLDGCAAASFLVADDVYANRLLVTRIIHSLLPEAEVIEAENGRIAVELCSRYDFDMVLMDVQMPEADGIEAAERIRQAEQSTGAGYRVPIVALSANTMDEEREHCLEAGMDDFLPKPVSRDALRAVLIQYIGS